MKGEIEMPKYRGTQKELKAEAQTARDWMIKQCQEAVADLDDLERQKFDELLVNAAVGDLSGFRQRITRAGGGYVIHREITDYFYEWKIGCSVQGHYGEQKFVLRKDGTIHAENLKTALEMWVVREISQDKRRTTLKCNRDLYEKRGSPADGIAEVELSKTEVGRCSVMLKKPFVKLGPKVCEISEIEKVVTAMMDIAGAYEDRVADYT